MKAGLIINSIFIETRKLSLRKVKLPEEKNKFTTIHVLVKENSQHRKAIGGGKQDTLAIEKIEVSAAKIVANRIFKV